MRDIDLEYYEGLLRKIGEIVRTPTNETRHRSAQVHFQSDFDAIRKIVATGLRRPVGNAQATPSRKQIEAVIDDYLGNIDATYEDSRQRCAQRIVDLYAVSSTSLGSAAK